MKKITAPSARVVEQSLRNIYSMSLENRQALLVGPKVTIRVGDQSIHHVPKYALMATSSVLNKHFINQAKSSEYRFTDDKVDHSAVRHLVQWLKSVCSSPQVFEVPSPKTFREVLSVLRAARLLGMNRYVKTITDTQIQYLKVKIPEYDEIVALEQMALSKTDPLWTTMVNSLCHDRFHGHIPDLPIFDKFVEQHPKLREAMRKTDKFFADRAMARRMARVQAQNSKGAASTRLSESASLSSALATTYALSL
jgi:hypothetical protein